jgi:hypothetical protein
MISPKGLNSNRDYKETREMNEKTVGYLGAFPATLYDNETPTDCTRGLTKREFFAALALAGILAATATTLEVDAAHAVKAADALIDALNAQ